jgi:3-isopropylmalate dehydrogenase
MPSACIGPEKSYVEPAHGSAPDIAGKNIANPYSMIGSVALMFDKCLGFPDEANDIWAALFAVFENGFTTSELSSGYQQDKVLSTSDFGDMVAKIIKG